MGKEAHDLKLGPAFLCNSRPLPFAQTVREAMRKPRRLASFPRDHQDKFMLWLSDGMRDRIKAVAEANNGSMNSEIVAN